MLLVRHEENSGHYKTHHYKAKIIVHSILLHKIFTKPLAQHPFSQYFPEDIHLYNTALSFVIRGRQLYNVCCGNAVFSWNPTMLPVLANGKMLHTALGSYLRKNALISSRCLLTLMTELQEYSRKEDLISLPVPFG